MKIKERNDKIIKDFKNLKTAAEIGRKHNISRARVGQIIKRELDEFMIDYVKKERSKKAKRDRVNKWKKKYQNDSAYRKKAINNARKRYYKIKDSQRGKIEFHLRCRDYFQTLATTLDLVNQKIDDKLSEEIMKQVICELIYLGDNYNIIKK